MSRSTPRSLPENGKYIAGYLIVQPFYLVKKKASLFVLLIGSAFSSYAQTKEASPWSVGLQAAAQRYEVQYSVIAGGKIGDEVGIIPAQAVVGYRVTPRLLFQLGVTYRKNSITTVYPMDSPLAGFVQRETYTSLPVPLTARYTVSRNLDKRLLLDVVGGVGVLYAKRNYLRVTSQSPLTSEPAVQAVTQAFLTFGLSGRYRFNSHWEGVADLLLNKSTKPGTTLSPRFYNAALGVRYNF